MNDFNCENYVKISINDVKPIPFLPNMKYATRTALADYFGISFQSMKSKLNILKDKMPENSVIRLTWSDFENAGYKAYASGNNHSKSFVYDDFAIEVFSAGILGYTEEAITFIALQFRNNPVGNLLKQKMCEREINNKPEVITTEATINNSNIISVFSNEEFGNVRVLNVMDDPWFIGKEVSSILGYKDTDQALRTHIDDEDRMTCPVELTGQKRNMVIINESGLYSLVMSSKLPTAKKFKRWVTKDILPSIRKTGGYILGQENMTESELMAKALIVAQKQIEQRDAKILSLTTENIALAMSRQTWDDKPIVNALVRAYAAKACKGNYCWAWNRFYKALRYNGHIDVRKRKDSIEKYNGLLIDLLSDDEMKYAISMAASMCKKVGLDISLIINETNATRISST